MEKLPVAKTELGKIVESNCSYADKVLYIKRLSGGNHGCYFLSRPRRFGKSLFVKTLKTAFECREKLFIGLYLENNRDWNTKYPLICISFGKIGVDNANELNIYQQNLLTSLFNQYKLPLIKNNKPTIASILLFSEIPQRHHIRIGRFKSASIIIDDRQITETLINAARKSIMYIKNYIRLECFFDGSIKRVERWEYLVEAMKESLLNVIVRRDYREYNDIQIKILDDKITIFSTGKLYGNIAIEQLKSNNYQSNLGNKLIA